MVKEIFHYIYCMSIPSTLVSLILVCSLWNVFASKIKKQSLWKIFNLVLFLVWLVCILYMTLFSREEKTEINLIPFRFLFKPFITGNEEFFRVGWMNILLFVPGGMWLSYFVKNRTKLTCFVQIIFLVIMSISIETMQWYYQLGTVETDDVICNSLGAIIGVTSFAWAENLVVFVKPYIIKFLKYIKQKMSDLMK